MLGRDRRRGGRPLGRLRDATEADYYAAKRKAAAVLGRPVRPGDLPSDAEVREQVLILVRDARGRPTSPTTQPEPEAPARSWRRLADHSTVRRLPDAAGAPGSGQAEPRSTTPRGTRSTTASRSSSWPATPGPTTRSSSWRPCSTTSARRSTPRIASARPSRPSEGRSSTPRDPRPDRAPARVKIARDKPGAPPPVDDPDALEDLALLRDPPTTWEGPRRRRRDTVRPGDREPPRAGGEEYLGGLEGQARGWRAERTGRIRRSEPAGFSERWGDGFKAAGSSEEADEGVLAAGWPGGWPLGENADEAMSPLCRPGWRTPGRSRRPSSDDPVAPAAGQDGAVGRRTRRWRAGDGRGSARPPRPPARFQRTCAWPEAVGRAPEAEGQALAVRGRGQAVDPPAPGPGRRSSPGRWRRPRAPRCRSNSPRPSRPAIGRERQPRVPPEWPASGESLRPVATSRSSTVPSSEPEASVSPLGENASEPIG